MKRPAQITPKVCSSAAGLSSGASGINNAGEKLSALSLRTGVYWVRTLTVAAGANLRLNAAAGPVVIYVERELVHSGAIVGTDSIWPALLLGFFGPTVELDQAPFHGVLVAPDATLTLGGATTHRGRFFARELRVSSGTQIIQAP